MPHATVTRMGRSARPWAGHETKDGARLGEEARNAVDRFVEGGGRLMVEHNTALGLACTGLSKPVARRTLGVSYFRVRKDWAPKGRKSRVIGINDALLPWLEKQIPRKSRYVFVSERGTPWRFFPQSQLDAVLEEAGLSGSAHKFRHSWATHFVLRTRDLFLTARLLGHSTAYVTERYAHLLPEHLVRAREALSISLPEGSPSGLIVIDGGKASGA